MKTKLVLIMSIMMLLLLAMVSASSVTTDALNFQGSRTHTVTITNTLSNSANSSSTLPNGFTFVSSTSGCTESSGVVTCNNIPSDGNASFIIQSPSNGVEYQLYDLTTTLDGNSLNDVKFINIKDDEIAHTLVEYGRGRGNYFYDSMGSATSAGTGTGYPYVPNGTDFELNFLHKIYNIKQYFSLASGSYATNVEFTCEYPYHTVVRQHLTESIGKDGSNWKVTYELPKIEGSWERMGFLGEDFDAGEYNVGDSFSVKCTNISYDLKDAHGKIQVPQDGFNLTIRNPNALGVTVSSGSSVIGNGTSEVVLTYTITNNEVYPVDSLHVDIKAPQDAEFVGVRGELWGEAKDTYSFDLNGMNPGESRTIRLVARFDTSSDSNTNLLLSQGITARYVPTWELNAYNPMAYTQYITVSNTQTVDYSVSSEVTNILDLLENINNTVTNVNNTQHNIDGILAEINSTTHTINTNVLAMNQSLSNQLTTNFNVVNNKLDNLTNKCDSLSNSLQQLINCTANPGAPICVKVDMLNGTITNMYGDMLRINDSLTQLIQDVNSPNSSVMIQEIRNQFAGVESNFTYTNNLISSINNSINTNIDSVNQSLSNQIQDVNNIVTNIQSDVNALNTTMYNINQSLTTAISNSENNIINNLSSQIGNVINSSNDILEELHYMQGFNEELIFLVTDSVGLAKDSKKAYDNGDVVTAKKNLEKANGNLEVVKTKIAESKKPLENKYEMKTTTDPLRKVVLWFKGFFI